MAGAVSPDYIDALANKLKYGTLSEAQEALESLVDLFGEALQSYFKSRLPSWAVTQEVHKDLEQEVWRILFENARSCTYDPERSSSVLSYIWGIAKRLLIVWWRKEARRQQAATQATQQKIQTQTVSTQQSKYELLDCLAKLAFANEDNFTAVLLVCLKGLSEREAAEVIGVVASTVNDRKAEGLRFLRDCLGYGSP